MKFGNEFCLILFQEYISPNLFAVYILLCFSPSFFLASAPAPKVFLLALFFSFLFFLPFLPFLLPPCPSVFHLTTHFLYFLYMPATHILYISPSLSLSLSMSLLLFSLSTPHSSYFFALSCLSVYLHPSSFLLSTVSPIYPHYITVHLSSFLSLPLNQPSSPTCLLLLSL
jgi:hypothetical protein